MSREKYVAGVKSSSIHSYTSAFERRRGCRVSQVNTSTSLTVYFLVVESVFLANSQISAQYRTITTRFIVKHNQWASINYQTINCLIKTRFWCFSAKQTNKQTKKKQHKTVPCIIWRWKVKCSHLSLSSKSTQHCHLVDRLHSLQEVLSIIRNNNSHQF